MLDRLEALGHLSHLRNAPPFDGGIQWAGLKRADKHPLVAKADWVLALDIDEFVNIHVGDHTLTALMEALPDAGAFQLTWRLFGNAGVDRYIDAPITRQFTRAAPNVLHWPWQASMFKTLFRNDGTYRKLGVHRPRSPDKSKLKGMRWFDGSGRELPDHFKTSKIFSNYFNDNHALVQLNHYPLGAKESFVLKSDRGRAVHGADTLGMDYWVARNFNTEEDQSVLALEPAAKLKMAELRADPKLSSLHDSAVAWRKSRFEQLMMEDNPRDLYGRLLATPETRPLSPESVQFIHKMAYRAQKRGQDAKT